MLHIFYSILLDPSIFIYVFIIIYIYQPSIIKKQYWQILLKKNNKILIYNYRLSEFETYTVDQRKHLNDRLTTVNFKVQLSNDGNEYQ